MEINVERNLMLKALARVQAVVEKRNTISILNNVMLDFDGGKLKLTAAGSNMFASDSVVASGLMPGKTTVPAQLLYDIIRKLPEGSNINIKTLSTPTVEQLMIEGSGSKFHLPCLPVDEFPTFEVHGVEQEFAINASIFRNMLIKVRHAISMEETRYYLGGAHLHILNDNNQIKLRLVTTDGHRLAFIDCAAPSTTNEIPAIIIPRRAVQEIIRLLDGYLGEVQISIAKNRISFIFDGMTLISRLIEGKFPEYMRVIPVDNSITMTVNNKELVYAIDLVTAISFDRIRTVKLEINGEVLKISTGSDLQGNASAMKEISCKSTSNAPMVINFNARYVMDILANIEDNEVQFLLPDTVGATIIRDSSGAVYVLMPLQL